MNGLLALFVQMSLWLVAPFWQLDFKLDPCPPDDVTFFFILCVSIGGVMAAFFALMSLVAPEVDFASAFVAMSISLYVPQGMYFGYRNFLPPTSRR